MKLIQIVAAIALIFMASPLLAQAPVPVPVAQDLLIGSYTSTQNVGGVTVTVPVSIYLKIDVHGDQAALNVRALADLSDLQAKIGNIIDTIAPMPRDNCAHYGIDNIVANLSTKQLSISGSTVTLKVSGDAEVWTCAVNPVPCTRCDMVLKNGPLGTRFSVPECSTYSCNPPIKNRNVQQPFDAFLPIALVPDSATTVAIQLGNPTITLGGTFGGVTDGILHIAGVDLNAKVKGALDQAINPASLIQRIPPDLARFNPAVKSASFLDDGGRLSAQIELTTTVSTDQLANFLLGLH